MKVAELSTFISFELTREEEGYAFAYNECQMAGIQNTLAACAEELVKVVMETDELSLEGAKKLAYTKGQIDILKYLLAMGDTIKEQRLAEQIAQESNPE